MEEAKKIKKRDGSLVDFESRKITIAMEKAFGSVNQPVTADELKDLTKAVENLITERFSKDHIPSVEEVQDLVEFTLIDRNYYSVVKAFILYRSAHNSKRKKLEDFRAYIKDQATLELLRSIADEFTADEYDLKYLFAKLESFVKKDMKEEDYLKALIRGSAELTAKEAPNWEFISGRFLSLSLKNTIAKENIRYETFHLADKIKRWESLGLYGEYIRQNYTNAQIDELEKYMVEERDHLFTYSALDLIVKRYLIRDTEGNLLETPQEMFMGIAMHLAIPEKENKVKWAKKIYDILSKLQVTMATPTISNARKPFHQLSSCFIDTVPDSLDGIYRSLDNFAQVSKHGGGMGMYYGKVRATGSDIRGFKGVAGGVIRWIRLANDTAVAVDQLGVRQGSVAVYLDVWHKDVPEFLQLRTNNGDDRMKAHDVFPGICYPDLFWRLAKENMDAVWYMMCPHEIAKEMGFCLEDYYGQEWEEKYWECVKNPRLSKRTMPIKEMIRLIIRSVVETGTPFAFNRDTVNQMNPNKHQGIIYSSNLCTEIMQNMKEIQSVSTEILTEDGDKIVQTRSLAGDFVVCNLASLVLGNLNLNSEEEMEEVVSTVVRALDNVIDLNYYPLPYAEITNQKYRAIGLGTSGYHHALVQHGISFSSEEHLKYMDQVYEKINYYAIKASSQIAAEKGSYSLFKGSEWEDGQYFKRRGYTSEKWQALQAEVAKQGLRNGYILAVAPTGSTSIIAGTTAGVDPVMSRYFLEEKKGAIIPRVAPGLNHETFWLYENAHDIDQNWVVRAAGVRQRHIDQGQSLNFYITSEFTMKRILNLYIRAWEEGVKSIYYVRSKSLEVEQCDSCSA
ncbi:ribonucleoside-diphosphate reductase subunit alpha [Clostridiales bacterium COT073_COT-073]|nr:ribonucleoside-diphosphate reductase subunit alpha [Clostridiales bacterium COT073_COT-073]